jgi:hypothetical protein
VVEGLVAEVTVLRTVEVEDRTTIREAVVKSSWKDGGEWWPGRQRPETTKKGAR